MVERQVDKDAKALVAVIFERGEDAFRDAFRALIQERRLTVWEACCLEERCRSIFTRETKKGGAHAEP